MLGCWHSWDSFKTLKIILTQDDCEDSDHWDWRLQVTRRQCVSSREARNPKNKKNHTPQFLAQAGQLYTLNQVYFSARTGWEYTWLSICISVSCQADIEFNRAIITFKEVVVLPSELHPLLYCGCVLSSIHPSLCGRFL